MGTAPNGWQTPKTDWQAADAPGPSDFNRIEGNSSAIETGDRTVDQTQSPTGHVGTLRQLLDWITNRIKAITGTTNWYDAPPTTLTAAKGHMDAASPHSGHATTTALSDHTSAAAPHSGHATTGALSSHTGETSAHSATSAATASRIMMRDAYGRAKVAAPSASDDVARKDTVDAHANRKDNPHTVTAAQIGGSGMLTELKKVDGAGSGLDADLWQGVEFAMPGDTVLITDSTFRQAWVDTPVYVPCFVTRPGKYRVTGTVRIAASGSNACVEIVKCCVVKSNGTLSTRTISNVFKTSSTTNVSFTLNTNLPIGLNEILVIKLYPEKVETARSACMEGFQVKYAPSTGDNLYHAIL